MTMRVFPHVFSYCCWRVNEDAILSSEICVNSETLCKINTISTLAGCRSKDSVHCPGKFLTIVLWEVQYLWTVSGLKASVFDTALLAAPEQFLTCVWVVLDFILTCLVHACMVMRP